MKKIWLLCPFAVLALLSSAVAADPIHPALSNAMSLRQDLDGSNAWSYLHTPYAPKKAKDVKKVQDRHAKAVKQAKTAKAKTHDPKI